MGIRKKRSVQFLVDCHLHDGECSGAGNFAEGSGYSSSHEGDNLSIRSAGSANRALTACPIRSASPRPSSSTGYPDSGDEGEDGSPISISRPANAPEDLAVFDIGLGMIRQHTIYRVQFLIPAAGRLDTEDVELVRSNVVVPEEGKQFKISADIDVIKIEYMKDDSFAYMMMSGQQRFSVSQDLITRVKKRF
ncbi:unnamed protein product [Hymenolepis diminuta]|uniref:Uncharacterized protein n=1 Tax=Hymenolepis diminuta TaxID=6216 RepID=A0A0R3SIJ1_HYMDI|nr:unnamed protein product [Hymenolepis diminuta]